MSWAPPLGFTSPVVGLFATSLIFIIIVLLRSGSADCRHFRTGLGFTIDIDDRRHTRAHVSGFGGQIDVVSRLEDVMIRGFVEGHICNLSPHGRRKLHGPQGFDSFMAAATAELRGLPTNVIDQLFTELRR